jgi:hypothetical protein
MSSGPSWKVEARLRQAPRGRRDNAAMSRSGHKGEIKTHRMWQFAETRGITHAATRTPEPRADLADH